ncbi:N-acetylgalactosamine kinase [Nilaparvata lugens]|uniref:N-acetylgalactosamine kinase n=1 Tax=Nilaparvata lugens TaxID=108931 RepID=UPI00193E43A1|nr:N-acetylgalactosamine kinase [Nilaparvata lugens]
MELPEEWCGSPITKVSELDDPIVSDKIKELKNHYLKKFNSSPIGYIQVPGRVNLIGEHIDYCGYPVCPMAIGKYILIAFGFSNEKKDFLHVTNLNKIHPDFVNHTDVVEVSVDKIGWTSYLLSGILGIKNKIESQHSNKEDLKEVKGLCLAVSGNIPEAAGLSSSSALVVAGSMIYSLVHKFDTTKLELAELCAAAENFVGTAGGGMDQTIILNADKGTSKLIEFRPLKVTNCVLPEGSVFVIANSLVEKNKAASSDFNTRVAECRIAAQIIAKREGCPDWKGLRTLSLIQKALKCDVTEMKDKVEQYFHESPYTKEEICKVLGITISDLDYLSLCPKTYNVETFKLKQRAMHVYSEAERVFTWKKYCEDGESIEKFGELMNASHDSLQNLYECSHPELDRLVAICRENGAYGARLTGAGWGGCMVALTSKTKVVRMMNALDNYYATKKDVDLDSALFAVGPEGGARVFKE